MFDLCTTGYMAHIDMMFKFLPHTRQHAFSPKGTEHYSSEEYRFVAQKKKKQKKKKKKKKKFSCDC
jgi:hypothetical protein